MKNILWLVSLVLFLTASANAQIYWKPTAGPHGLDIADVLFTSNKRIVVSAYNSGIFISGDRGSHWIKFAKNLETETSYAFHLAEGKDGTIFAIINQILYRLDANSDEWRRLSFNLPAASKLFTNPHGGIYIIGPDATIYYSNDDGNNFRQIVKNGNFKALSQAFFNGKENNYINVLEGGGAAVYRLNDDGTNLIKLIHLPTQRIIWHPAGYLFGFAPTLGIVRMDSNGMNQFWTNPFQTSVNKIAMNSNGDIFAFTNDGDYESNDLGLNYKLNTTKLYERIEKNSEVYFFEDQIYIYNDTCNTGDFEVTMDFGENWASLDSSFFNPLVKDLFIDKLGRLFAKTCGVGKYSYSLDGGDTWNYLKLPSDIKPSIDLTSTVSGTIFVLLNSNLYKSSDLGNSWALINFPSGNNFNRLKGDQENKIFAFGNSASYYSKDGGQNWNPVSIPPALFDNLYFHPDGTIFAVSHTIPIRGIFYSEDEGLSWKSSKTEFPIPDGFCISNQGIVYASGSTNSGFGTFISYDNLNSLTKLTSNVYRSLLTDNNGTIYGLIESKCERSMDEGKTWSNFRAGLPVYRVYNAMDIDNLGHLYLGMDDEVVFKTINSVTADINVSSDSLVSDIFVQPNPVSHILNVRIHRKNFNSGFYRIFDQRGSLQLEAPFSSNFFNIDCSKLSNGVVFMQVFGMKSLKPSMYKIVISR
ncbi:MAG: exo-alpha-sialidase [Saprospiraceae bacterium]|nr:exo-alpha-sialidase [Saprospiraceae bacterium]